MFHNFRLAPRGRARYLCLIVIHALVVSLTGPVMGQAPLPSPSPGGIKPPPLSAPSHPAGPTVPPPHPANGVPAATLPNIDAARNLVGQALPALAPVTPIVQLRCDYGCGGDEPPPGGSPDPDFSTARVRPQNEAGQAGVDLGSRNFNWSLPLVGLSGRAGLDLNLALYYNSLVWTPEGSEIRYNSDRAFPGPGPGFSLGLPKLQQRYVNQDFGVYAYMLVTPSGGHVELRQVGASNTYESADSSYTQLTDNGATKLLLTKNGSQYSFVASVDGEFRCVEIKDRNGNYISAAYNANSDISTVTDTLGRIITFNYDGANYLLSITQTWTVTVNGQAQPITHNWAVFGYSNTLVQTNFPGFFVQGPNNTTIPVLSSVSLADNSSYNFDYTSWGQVYQIRQNAADGHMRSRQTYNLPQDATTAQYECPRFTERRDWAEYWMEVTTQYGVDPGGGWTRVTQPDGTVYKEYFATADWQKGLTVRTELYAADDLNNPRKWTTIDWTQDDVNLPYQLNPRPSETNIYDSSGNRRRTSIDYTSYGLPSAVREWTGASADVLYRLTTTGYRFDGDYLNRRIIGLVDNVQVTDGAGALVSKTTFAYDWTSSDMFQDTPTNAIQHDLNYGPGMIYGRGNRSQMARWDVNDPQNINKTLQTKFGVNSTGAIVLVRDPLWHETLFNYGDSFSEGGNRNTFALPTTITDPDGNSSTAQYNYDFGAATRTQDPKGAVAVFAYDLIGRLARVTNQFNNAYTRWVYPASQNYVDTFSTIQEGMGEAYSMQVFDGDGRVYTSVSALPGSVGGYTAQAFQYDAMGRLSYQSNPTEVSGSATTSWVPAGDDVAGWKWTQQSYDYKGRPTTTVNSDGTTRGAIYGGCGCAGGEVVTLRDETGRRKRITQDVLGRQSKVEELNWDQSVYSTTTFAYNAEDQITNITQQNDRVRSFVYDGYGRLQTRTTPEQGATTYSYFNDDTVQTVTDARGASQTFSYNARHLPLSITYGVPSGVEPTPNVAFGYDAAGNRTWMTDGFGRVDYAYDTLSRMTSETRQINGVGSYPLGYQYNLAGELTRITNPWNVQVGYDYDAIGRLSGMTGANYGSVNTYLSGITYRAFGGVKAMSYGNGRSFSAAYDDRLRLTKWDVTNVLGYNYTYNNTYFHENTGRVSYAQNIYDSTLDRSYEYDSVGRLVVSHSGAEARAHAIWGQWGTQDGPYSQGYDYDAWGNITSRAGWGGWNASYNVSFNSKNQQTNHTYDAAGNLTNDSGQPFTYDATGAQVQAPANGVWQGHDGDGLRVKNVEGSPTYYLHSTVLGGQVVAELNGSGGWTRGYVYAGGQLIALQEGGVYWAHQDPINKSQRLTDMWGNIVAGIELDPWGGETNRSWNTFYQPHRYTSWERGWTGDESLFRRYHGWFSRFAHPDPYDGSYNSTDPQSFNRYAYVQNDPVNFVDPSGLDGEFTCVPGDPMCALGSVTVYGGFGPLTGGGGGGIGHHDALAAVDAGVELENPGGGAPQDRLPTHPPSRTANRSQQKQFDECARTANRRYRSEYLRTSTKALAGAAGVAAGLLVGGLAFRGAMHAAGDVALPAFARVLTTGMELGDAGVIVTISSYVSGKAALDAIREGERNSNRRESEIEDCKKRFPNANHSFSTLNF